ncbi:post-transcriptional regulator [Solibacillus sp. FSL H8-0538]|uniref:post-transcriptional regulator n=1 Tax=Solibacillus sp. FSL H8-0538 TaxID=2921400 RepID=UPI0030FA810F
MAIPYQTLYEQVQLVLNSKIEEFRYYDYNAISKDDLWRYCIKKKWRKVKIEDLHLYEIVATIYSVSPSEIVSYDQINDLKEQPQLVGITEDELKALLNPGPNLEKVNME